jgi:hypothetical protein
MLAGAAWREDQEWQRTAWATAHMINISGKSVKQAVTAAKLLGKPQKARKVQPLVKDPELDFKELWARHEERKKKQKEG